MKDFVRETLQTILSSIILTAFIYFFIATPNEIKGVSMMPNVQNGDLILTNRTKHLLGGIGWGWDYKRGEVVIFKLPGREAYIKRIIATPGDTVQIIDGEVIVNEKVLDEDYLDKNLITKAGDFLGESPTTVPEGTYLAFGDNRGKSLDSRFSDVGFIERRYMIGPAALRIFPFKRFGVIPVGEFTESDIDLEIDGEIQGINDNFQINILDEL